MKTRQTLVDELKLARRELATCSGTAKNYWHSKIRECQRRLNEMSKYDGNPLNMRTPWRRMPAGKSRYFEEV